MAEGPACSLTSDAARNKTYALLAGKGEERQDFDAVFAQLQPDMPSELDGIHDPANMPVAGKPNSIRTVLATRPGDWQFMSRCWDWISCSIRGLAQSRPRKQADPPKAVPG